MQPDILNNPWAQCAMHPPSWSFQTPAADDILVEAEPSRHVDYLSHDWKEEDIWTSWRYVTARKISYSNGLRLENASWRTWVKVKNSLGTVSPETLNWLKDCDVTWLYGPLKTSCFRDAVISDASPPASRLEITNSHLKRKPILKKKTASEAILQRSLSQHTLLRHAGAILKAKEAENGWARPLFPSSNTDLDQPRHWTESPTYSLVSTLTASSSSGLTTPSERRHIHFNNEVVQCIAVDAKEGEEEASWLPALDEESSDDGMVMMRYISPEAFVSNPSTTRNSSSSGSKAIAPLPPTTLKHRGEAPGSQESVDRWSGPAPSSILSPTPSVETPSNFLLDEEDPSLDFDGEYSNRYGQPLLTCEDKVELADHPLQLSASDMFMPYGNGEGEPVSNRILNRVMETINTARDIAYVIWNLGWRR